MSYEKHGMSNSKEWLAWKAFRQRCDGKTYPRDCYYNYFLRGIDYCKEWESFTQFYKDMGPAPSKKHSLDRIDNNKGYYPDNCRWALRSTQNKNRRKPKVKYIGVTKTRYNTYAGRYKNKFVTTCKTFEEARFRVLSEEVKIEVIDSGLFSFLCS